MDEQKNNIRILFTVKANSALDDIMKSFNLEETPAEAVKRGKEKKLAKIVIIDHLSKDFASGIISEKDLANSLQKDLEVSQQTAEQITKEVITKIIPFLEKVPEEKLKDPAFVEELSKKVFGETIKQIKVQSGEEPFGMTQGKKDTDIFPKIKPSESAAESIEKNIPEPEEYPKEKPKSKTVLPPKKQERIKKPIAQEKIKESAPQITKQPKGPDSYREPIE